MRRLTIPTKKTKHKVCKIFQMRRFTPPIIKAGECYITAAYILKVTQIIEQHLYYDIYNTDGFLIESDAIEPLDEFLADVIDGILVRS